MTKLAVEDCRVESTFDLVDPTSFLETAFEAEVVKALTCLEQDYWCGVFAGTFVHEGERRSADLVMVHKKFTHWFVVEVEVAGHSLHEHIVPQIRCFRYGEPEQSCITSLIRAFPAMTPDQASALLTYVPRHVVVVGNFPNSEWKSVLQALDAQYLTLSVYRNPQGRCIHVIDGRLTARTESLGFARYSAIDNCLRLHRGSGLHVGQVQIVDQFGNPAMWTVREHAGALWIAKVRGPALLDHDSYVQLLRAWDGRLVLRPSIVR